MAAVGYHGVTFGLEVPMRRTLFPVLFLISACTSPEGVEPGDCADALDNDGDGLYDCDDPDCSGAPDCSEGDADTDADADSDTDADTDTGPWEDCEVEIEEVVPDQGATDVYYRTDVEFHLSDSIPGAPVIELVGPAGQVPGTTTLSEDGELVWFELGTPLEPLTSYTATLDYCAGEASFLFTTSELGRPCEAGHVGKVYAVDLGEGRFLEPAGVGDLIGEYMTTEAMVAVLSESGVELDVILGFSEEDSTPPEQDLCFQTVDLRWAHDQAPYFSYGPQDTSYTTASGTFTIMDLEMSGAFASDGSWFGGGELAMVLDCRELVVLIDEVDNAADMCNLSASFGAPCQACPSDGQEYCLAMRADQLVGEQVLGGSLEEVPAAGHEDCDGPGSCGGCASSGRGPGLGVLGMLAGLVALGARRRRRWPSWQ